MGLFESVFFFDFVIKNLQRDLKTVLKSFCIFLKTYIELTLTNKFVSLYFHSTAVIKL